MAAFGSNTVCSTAGPTEVRARTEDPLGQQVDLRPYPQRTVQVANRTYPNRQSTRRCLLLAAASSQRDSAGYPERGIRLSLLYVGGRSAGVCVYVVYYASVLQIRPVGL
jgi:hypothetical protein